MERTFFVRDQHSGARRAEKILAENEVPLERMTFWDGVLEQPLNGVLSQVAGKNDVLFPTRTRFPWSDGPVLKAAVAAGSVRRTWAARCEKIRSCAGFYSLGKGLDRPPLECRGRPPKTAILAYPFRG